MIHYYNNNHADDKVNGSKFDEDVWRALNSVRDKWKSSEYWSKKYKIKLG